MSIIQSRSRTIKSLQAVRETIIIYGQNLRSMFCTFSGKRPLILRGASSSFPGELGLAPRFPFWDFTHQGV
jgi:hypothetical protein